MVAQHEGPAFFTGFLQRRIPGYIITLRIISAAIKGPAPLRASFHDHAAAFRAQNTGILQNWLGIAALRESRAGQELAIASLLDHHHAAAKLALYIGHLNRKLHMANGFIGLFQSLFKRTIEFAEQLILLHLALGNFIQLVFKAGCKLHIDDILKIFLQHVHNDKAKLRWLKMLFNPLNVAARKNGLNDRRVGTRTANFLLLQSLDQRRFVIARRRLCKMLLRHRLIERQCILLRKLRQHNLFLLLVLCTGVHGGKACKAQMRTAGTTYIARPGRNGYRQCIINCRHHLTGDKTLPDQGIEPVLITGKEFFHILRCKFNAGRTYGFMCILRLLRCGIYIRFLRNKICAKGFFDICPCHLKGFGRNTRRIRTHISNESDRPLASEIDALIQLLREHHGLA